MNKLKNWVAGVTESLNLNLDSNIELTDASITSIINNLKYSLEALSVACKEISFEKVLELKSPDAKVTNSHI